MNTQDDDLFRKIRERVVHGEKTGRYPVGLDRQLEATFGQIMRESHGSEKLDNEELLEQVEKVKLSLWSLNTDVATSSRIPGGQLVHKFVARLVRRHTAHLASQVHQLIILQQQQCESLIARTIKRDFLELRRADALSQHVLERLAILDYLVVEFENLRSQPERREN